MIYSPKVTPSSQNIINHVGLVLDASSSMKPHARELVKVVDGQIENLAQLSKSLDQETRVTVYTFSWSTDIRCLIYDKDVLRMPSIKGLYDPAGMTALIDATLLCIDDLSLTPEKYGEHSYLIYDLTDGINNDSRQSPAAMASRIARLPDNWTLGVFVPDQAGIFAAKKNGFPAGNISVWNPDSAQGIAEVGETIRRTSESFMQGRARGVRGSRTLFSLNDVSARDVQRSLVSLTSGSYFFLNVTSTGRIDEFVEAATRKPYMTGRGYYQLSKPETIQAQKEIAIQAGDQVYAGPEARKLLGLPDFHVRVNPADHTDYTIFVQSTSRNRKLIAGTRLLVMR